MWAGRPADRKDPTLRKMAAWRKRCQGNSPGALVARQLCPGLDGKVLCSTVSTLLPVRLCEARPEVVQLMRSQKRLHHKSLNLCRVLACGFFVHALQLHCALAHRGGTGSTEAELTKAAFLHSTLLPRPIAQHLEQILKRQGN